MNIIKNQYSIILIALISFLLLISIFKWIDYLVTNNYVKLSREGFDTNTSDTGSPDTSHNVDMPLTTTTSCKNMCGPPNRCSITGQQCMSDIDCPGCEPQVPPLSSSNEGSNIIGDDDAGKLTAGVTPNYSPLTTGFGTQSRIVTSDKFSKPSMPNFGVNTWSSKFIKGRKLFDDRYKPAGLKNMPSYSDRYSLTGEFIDDGPLPSNAYLK
jgi:hypothetical protein